MKGAINKPLLGRVALVTGASRGIGSAVARSFAKEGAHIILLARNLDGLEQTDDLIRQAGGTATLFPFDLTETKKIDAIGRAVFDKFGRLDILVGNAAILGSLSPIAQSDAKVFEEVFKINFFANYHLIRTLDPLLRVSPAGRAMFVTSGVAHMRLPFWGAYGASKAALEHLVETYAEETKKSALKVSIVDPGVVRTDMRAQAAPAEDPMSLPSPEDIAGRFLDLAA